MMNKYSISLFNLCVLILSSGYGTKYIFNSAFPTKTCDFPAVFNFGDSNSDTGELAAAFTQPNWPHGQTFFHKPAGRTCDGRLIIDFIAESFGLPYLSAYLDSLGTNFIHGANFASDASTIRLQNKILPNRPGYSPFYLDVQLLQFMQFKSRSQMIREGGGIYANLMPPEEHFSEALYTIDIGQNDLGGPFFFNMSLADVNASVPDMINKFSENVKNLYNSGARKFWIHNTGPLGCMIYILANFPSPIKDAAGCSQSFNELCQYFNLKLKEGVVQLRKDFPSATLIYVDIYSVKYSLFKEPSKYGFELPLVACCGYGDNQYNFTSSAQCGRLASVNGTQIIVGSSGTCDRPSARVIWDGSHLTEAANKFIFEQISTGNFSDPPIPLKMLACHST